LRILVTGGTGFVGTYLVNELLKRRHDVAVLERRTGGSRNRYNRPVEPVSGDVLDRDSLVAASRGRDAVIHLVGIIHEHEEETFDRIHREAPENVVAALPEAGVSRLLHMSAMGSSEDSPSEYGRTKAAGQSAVCESLLSWTVFRPSVIFGPGDGFVSLLAGIVRGNPGFIPVIGSGRTRFQPVSVRDVARVFADSLERPETVRRVFEVGGPRTLTLDEIYREIAAAVGKPRKPLVHLPLWWGRFLAQRFEAWARRGWLDAPPLTRDQLKSLERDNVADLSDTLAVFGAEWGDFSYGIREYLRPRRRHDPRFGIGTEANLDRVRTLRVR